MKCCLVFIVLQIFALALSLYGSARTSIQDVFIWNTEAAEQVEVDKNRKITWIGSFTTREKEKLLEYLDQEQDQFKLPVPFSHSDDIVKSDLDGDGQSEFLMHLNFRWPAAYSAGRVLALVSEGKDRFKVRVVSGPKSSVRHRGRDAGIVAVHLRAIDFDSDGLKDIVETNILEDDPEQTGDYYDSVIYRNFKIKGQMHFKKVYEKITYDYPRFEDLDGNGKLELLETVNDLPYETYMRDPKWRWINVYDFNGQIYQKANAKYLSFYLKKEKDYEALLKEAIEKDIEFKKKGKRTIYETAMKAMKAYLQRIDEMKRRRS